MPHGSKKRGRRGKRNNNPLRYERRDLPSNFRSAEADQRHLERAIAKRLKLEGANLGAASSSTGVADATLGASSSNFFRVSLDSDSDFPPTERDLSSAEEESQPETQPNTTASGSADPADKPHQPPSGVSAPNHAPKCV